ncbi:shikimate kinase [Novosphingobium piscinae]|uniref:Shikimate kinase n=1 Tax=Novosphingobium piscinae TaxID=1507448 RepID=A0A7X1FYL4_9SPHN|nr:shikimate kinase [Novosphingobium piscinae]MBC2669301.1 helix-turn-helix domain-containing protein [Novosphingobium piscinae]
MADTNPDGFTGGEEIGQQLRSARALVGLTRKQLAAASGASERYLATLEGGSGNPSVGMLIAIADALNLAPAELLPMGGERDVVTAKLVGQLRRLPVDRAQEVLAALGRPQDIPARKAGRISLIGLRGAGKSSLGLALAERLQLPFFEVSKEVERRYGGSIGIMMEINGPQALRRYEAEVLDELLERNPAAVIAAPGAIVSSPALYDQLLGSTWSVWLEATPEDHMQRVVDQGDLRPMSGNRAAMNDLKTILAARSAEYARADVRIDTSAQDFAATLNLLEKAVRALL